MTNDFTVQTATESILLFTNVPFNGRRSNKETFVSVFLLSTYLLFVFSYPVLLYVKNFKKKVGNFLIK